MKIAYIGIKKLPSQAGADRVVEAIVQRLAPRYALTVYCSSQLVPPQTTFPGIELIRISTPPGKHAHATLLFLKSALHALVCRNFDLIHIHNVEACFVVPLLKIKYRVLATSHGQAYARDKWNTLAKALIRTTDWPYARLADCATCVSKPLADYYTSRYGVTIHYVPNGVDDAKVDLTAAQDLLRIYSIKAGQYVLFAAGRIIPTKGAETLLAAYRALATNLKLLVVGDTTQVTAYERMLHQLADSRVVFIPPLGKTALLGLVKLARFFVFPSTVEAMSMMLLEAASVGAPIISSDIPENMAVLPQRALFFRKADAEDLRDKMCWALQHPEQMSELGAKARAWVMEQYHWDSIISQYEALYQAVQQGRREKSSL